MSFLDNGPRFFQWNGWWNGGRLGLPGIFLVVGGSPDVDIGVAGGEVVCGLLVAWGLSATHAPI